MAEKARVLSTKGDCPHVIYCPLSAGNVRRAVCNGGRLGDSKVVTTSMAFPSVGPYIVDYDVPH